MKIHRTLKLVKPQPTMVPGDSGVSCCLLAAERGRQTIWTPWWSTASLGRRIRPASQSSISIYQYQYQYQYQHQNINIDININISINQYQYQYQYQYQ